MTLAELGAQLKLIHPQYKNDTDREIGKRLQAKYPGFYQTEPASKLESKFDELESGMRRVVFVPRGTKDNPNAADYGMKRLTLPSGSYFYDPQVIRPQEIMAAIRDHNTEDLLAPVAVEEEEAPPEPMPQGEELQDAIDSAGDAGGPKAVEIPKVDIQDKVAAATRRRGDRWPKPGGPVRLPIEG